MEASPMPGQTIRLLLEITRAPDGRLEGRIRTGAIGGIGGSHGTAAWSSFSGVLELLKTLEDHL